jgi:hypothetical protein
MAGGGARPRRRSTTGAQSNRKGKKGNQGSPRGHARRSVESLVAAVAGERERDLVGAGEENELGALVVVLPCSGSSARAKQRSMRNGYGMVATSDDDGGCEGDDRTATEALGLRWI